MKYNLHEIKSAACHSMEQLVTAPDLCLSGGRREGFRYWCFNPHRNEARATKFCIDIGGAKPGRFKDFASDDGGDVIDLVAYCLDGPSQFKTDASRGRAIAWLGNFLGLSEAGSLTDQERKAREARYAKQREEQSEQERIERLDRARRAKSWWLRKGVANCRNTPVWSYLTRERQVPVEALDPWPGAIRWLPPYRNGNGVEKPGAMFCAMVRDSDIVAVHMTALTPDGKKAETGDAVKKMWGDKKGSAIRLSKGLTSKTPEQMAREGLTAPLTVLEGIEDALIYKFIYPEHLVWAAGDVGNLSAVAEVGGWPACASEVVLGLDQDSPGSSAEAGSRKAVRAWLDVSEGRSVRELTAAQFKDFSDAWCQS